MSRTKFFWYIYGHNNYDKFNFEYVPVPWEDSYIHVWGTQWHQHGGAYLANKHTIKDYKWHFQSEQVLINPSQDNWKINYEIVEDDFDWSWRPHPHDPPYIYVFGNQWHSPERMPTLEYHVPGATDRKYVHDLQATLTKTTAHWKIIEDVPIDFDFSWCPDPYDPPYIYVFGNQHWDGESSATVEYHTPGATQRKFVDTVQATLGTLDIFFIDHNNAMSVSRFAQLKETYPAIQKTRYMNSMMETIQRCINKSRTSRFWVISSENDYLNFDFEWQPDPWQQHMTHVFGSQWNKWSNTFLINKWEFERNARWAKGIEEFPNLNFVKNQLVRASDDANNIYYVDWGNPESQDQLVKLKVKYPNIKTTRYVDNYLDTFKRIMSTADTEHVWIINSIVDYSKFDFSWQPEAWQAEMIHVFPTGFEKRGDTFYINVEMFKQQIVELELLDWFNVINYCDEQKLSRWPVPTHVYNTDDLVTEVRKYQFEYPYAIFTNAVDKHHFDMCLWSKKDRVVEGLSASGSVSVVPRDVKSDLRTQIYDYPYVNTQKLGLLSDESLDIIYISNGEPDAEHWYNHLSNVLEQEAAGYPTLKYNNTIKRVTNVNGRAAAYKAAAERSSTPWFFAVFAKLEVNPDFDWDWQPDYWQEPKHYIFHARNPVNGLEYGHQAMIAYNKRLVLETDETGLDFTLSKAHEVVPLLSGTAHFNQDPWMTWRTAFREVLKLKQFEDQSSTMEGRHRLRTWLNKAEGDYAEWCLRGAQDAVAYYNSVNGDQLELMRSFEWDWLRDYFNQRYKNA